MADKIDMLEQEIQTLVRHMQAVRQSIVRELELIRAEFPQLAPMIDQLILYDRLHMELLTSVLAQLYLVKIRNEREADGRE